MPELQLIMAGLAFQPFRADGARALLPDPHSFRRFEHFNSSEFVDVGTACSGLYIFLSIDNTLCQGRRYCFLA